MKKQLLFNLFLAATLHAAASYNGRVFIDRNGNGIFDPGEKPMKGVCVSDGLNVTTTDKEGNFTLAGHERERFIFITTPSGYKTLNRYYLPIKETTSSYDFGLLPYDAGIGKDGAHSFVQVTDTEIFNTTGNDVWVDNLRQYAANEKVAFIMHTGDICYENGLKAHIELMNTANMNVPVFYGIGNHDLVKGKYGEELFEKLYGPVYYSFDVAGVHYVMTPMAGGDHQPGYTKDDVCRWLKNDLAQVGPNTPVYIFNHDLLTYNDDFTFRGKTESIDLNAYNLKAWIYGHWHINYKKKQGKVYTICTSTPDKGGIDHSVGAYRVIHVDGKGDFTSELRYCYQTQHLCIASPAGRTASAAVTVNAYSSVSPVKKVTYTCKDGQKILLKNQPLTQRTDWSWTADMKLKNIYIGKELTLQAVAELNNGEVLTQEQRFTYLPASVTASPDKNWDNLLGNAAHTGKASVMDSTLTLAWTRNIGANLYMSSPLIHDGKIFVASVDEDLKGNAYIYALDIKTGNPVWKFQVRNSIKNSIAIADGLVFAQDVEGNLYAVDCENGTLRWQEALPVNGLPALIEGLVTHDGIVYAGTGKAFSAFEAKTGKLLWRNEDWNQGEGTTSTLSIGDGVVISSVQWSALHANDLQTGKKLWSISEYGLRNRGASAAIHNGLVYLISDHSFFIIEARTGRIVVRKTLDYSVDVTSTPLLTDKEIIFGTAQKGVVALDNQTLEEIWNCPTGDALVYTSPYTRPVSATVETSAAWAGDLVFVAASDGNIYGINRADGTIKWKHAMGAPSFGSVAISGNVLIATDFGGNIYTFCCEKGDSLRIMSYNIRNAIGTDQKQDYKRVAAIISDANPDVIALQELDSVTHRSKNTFVLEQIAKHVGMNYVYGPAIDYDGGKYGIGILSKEKPLKVKSIALPGREEARTLLMVEFKDYIFLATHLSLTALDQLASVDIILKEIKDAHKPVFMAGDMNSVPASATQNAIRKHFEVLTQDDWKTCGDACIDFIYGYKDSHTRYSVTRKTLVEDRVASDHCPVLIDVCYQKVRQD